jgi:RHS repeat-associated protein
LSSYAWGCTWAPPAGASVATQLRYVGADTSFGGGVEVAYPDSSKEYYSSAFEWILRRISRQNDTVFYGYDSDDRVTAISDPYRTDPGGSPYNNHTYWHLAYGAFGLDSIVEPDSLGKHGKGRITLVRNDANAYLRSWTDPDGDSTTFGYDTQGRLDSITDRNGHLTRYVYNSSTWKIDSVISSPIPIDSNSTGSPVTASLRSFYSPPQTLVLPTGRTSATSPAPTIRTDSLWGHVVDNAGHTTQLQVDPWGQIIKYKYPNGYTYGYVRDGNGFPLSYSDTAGVQNTYTYSGPFLTSTTPAGQNTTYYGYGLFAQLDTVYGVGQPTQKLFIDTATWKRGHVDSVQVVGTTIMRYYAQHSAVAPGRDSMSVDANGDTTTFGYDATTGNRNHVADTLSGRYTTTTFDSHGRVASVFVGGLGGSATTTMTYDIMNRLKTVVNAKGTTTYGYDHLYQDSITDPNNRLYTTAYNAVGWATSQTDPTSRTLSTTYNGLGLPAVVTNRRGQPTTYTYDNLGRLLSETRPHAFTGDADTTITFSYSFFSDTVVAQTPVVADTTFYSRSSGWADSSITGLNGKKFKRYYHHDAMGRVDSLSITTTASNGIDPFTRHYYYNATYGYLDSLKLRTQKITFAYNAIYQDTNITYPTSAARHDAYTSTGTILTSAWTGLGVTMSRGYGYDSTGRIVEEDFDGNAYGDTTNLFTYDPIGELVQRRIGTWADTVTCIIKKGGQGCIYGDSASVSVLQQDSTLWDAAGNLDSVKVGSADTAGTVLPGNRISTWTGLTFGSDSDGNRDSTNNGSTTTKYVWSSDGLLRQVISGSTTRTYDYDENGQLVRRSENGTPDQYYLWDQGQLIAILNSAANNRIAEFAYLGTDRPIARITGNNGSDTVHYYAQDAVGNVFSQWNGGTAAVEQKLAYDPWGAATISTTTADTTQLQWKGLLYEGGVTSLYYMRARWYDPVTRRFISADPLGLTAGINQYAFAGGDPINGSDPSGMDACDGGDDEGDYTECSPGGGDTGPGGPAFTCDAGSTGGAACLAAAQQFVADLALDPSLTENLDFDSDASAGSVTCVGTARILGGNPRTIGRNGAFGTPVAADGAAVIPEQWGGNKGALRPYLSQISGSWFLGGFNGITDVIGSNTVQGVRDMLMDRYPNTLIIEVPGGHDQGVTGITLTVPSALGCPEGTGQTT